jgi:hypothetical protein
MYCPNCGQSQNSADVRFCSRCGLSLWELARWLSDGTNAPWAPVQQVGPSPRKKGIRRGAKILFIGGVLLPVFFALAVASDGPGFLVIPFLTLFVGLVWMAYYRLFVDDVPAPQKQIPAPAYRANEYLPPAQANPVNVLRPREPNTSEIVQPPSVTEYTTNLLGNRKKT